MLSRKFSTVRRFACVCRLQPRRLTMVAPRPLEKLLQLLQEYGPTAFTQITHFLMLTSPLKYDILLTQFSTTSPDSPPRVLPISIIQFLSKSLCLPTSDISHLWETFRDDVWFSDRALFSLEMCRSLFASHGLQHCLSEWIHNCIPLFTHRYCSFDHTLSTDTCLSRVCLSRSNEWSVHEEDSTA